MTDSSTSTASLAEDKPLQIYQYSLLSALVCSLYTPAIARPMSHLAHHGNFGLGTFVDLDGEMIMLDGVAYRMAYDGSISVIPPERLMTFATLVWWPETSTSSLIHTHALSSSLEKGRLQEVVEVQAAKNSTNHFLAIKITGVFKHVQMRTAKGVTSEQNFKDVASTQRVEDVEDVRGTMLGFRAPEWVQGVTVAGYHLHFINEEKDKGGHVLRYTVGEGAKLEIMVVKNLRVELPGSEEFGKANIKLKLDDIVGVEGK